MIFITNIKFNILFISAYATQYSDEQSREVTWLFTSKLNDQHEAEVGPGAREWPPRLTR